ncbi:unnamed protein product [Peronospora belbahrii]|uniref:6-pyruvoyltetrahydropterin synthase n=1 Tax=Peronospora belbahrii TaxID=622444 RepID=A0AAU9LJJ6_9STRA|nr:unnamed protein product [Peronospora belbahrii]CAH0522203.1 unnamed protein product [Peronospora belbahrii]
MSLDEEDQNRFTEQEQISIDAPSTLLERKRRKRNFEMGKELSSDQKAIVKMYVTRGVSEGVVKCCYCDKEISSRNVDRWASHLRGCVKTPEDVKAQIQPFRSNSSATSGSSTSDQSLSQSAKIEVPTTVTAETVTSAASSTVSEAPTGAVVVPSSLMPSTRNAVGSGYTEVFKVHVSKDYMKFNAAHFIAYKGFREKLHGHNYRLAVTIVGQVGLDGYVVDFGEIKKISRVICKDLNESFLVPMNSDALKISFDDTNVRIITEDMAEFSFPKSDCSLLPIVHSSAEELAIYISNQLVDAFTLVALLERGVSKVEVSISEANQQFASYERSILA